MRDPHILVIFLRRKCTAACRVCCFGCTPKSSAKLPKRLVHSVIAQSAGIKQIHAIAFSGGEPIIDPSEFKELVSAANVSGKRSYVTTNASWAASYEETFELLAFCKKNKLARVRVSPDKYHLEFVPIENINNVLLACQRLGIRSELNFVTLKGDKIGSIIDRLDSELWNLNISITPCSPVGAAKKNFPSESFIRGDVPITGLKCYEKHAIAIRYNGEVYPCCSTQLHSTALSLGNIRAASLEELYHKQNLDPVCMYLNIASFDELVKHAEKVGVPLPARVWNACELCGIFFGKKYFDVFASFIREHFNSSHPI